jgi:hypothetical protein
MTKKDQSLFPWYLEVQKQLRLANTNITSIASLCGTSRQNLIKVIHGEWNGRKAQLAVARLSQVSGVPLPDWYSKDEVEAKS